jgi:hypothetical protein
MLLQVLPLVMIMSGQAPPQQAPPPTPVQRPAQAQRKIYNETADAKAQIATALKGAADDDIRVLINWGANDDENCTKFQQAAFGPAQPMPPAVQRIRTSLSVEYKLVTVDVGHLDKNQDLAKLYHTTLAAGALPHLTILDKNGKVVAEQSSRDFAAAPGGPTSFDPEKVAAFLTKNQAPSPGNAEPLFRAAIEKAKRADKDVFVWFAAPW